MPAQSGASTSRSLSLLNAPAPLEFLTSGGQVRTLAVTRVPFCFVLLQVRTPEATKTGSGQPELGWARIVTAYLAESRVAIRPIWPETHDSKQLTYALSPT